MPSKPTFSANNIYGHQNAVQRRRRRRRSIAFIRINYVRSEGREGCSWVLLFFSLIFICQERYTLGGLSKMTETEPGARRHYYPWECNVNAELYISWPIQIATARVDRCAVPVGGGGRRTRCAVKRCGRRTRTLRRGCRTLCAVECCAVKRVERCAIPRVWSANASRWGQWMKS